MPYEYLVNKILKLKKEKKTLHFIDRYYLLRFENNSCNQIKLDGVGLVARHSKCLNHHNQRLCKVFFGWRKFVAPNIQCFVVFYFLVSLSYSLCVKNQ